MLANPSASSRPNTNVMLLGAAETLNVGLIAEVGVEPPLLSEQPAKTRTSSTVGTAVILPRRLNLLSVKPLRMCRERLVSTG